MTQDREKGKKNVVLHFLIVKEILCLRLCSVSEVASLQSWKLITNSSRGGQCKSLFLHTWRHCIRRHARGVAGLRSRLDVPHGDMRGIQLAKLSLNFSLEKNEVRTDAQAEAASDADRASSRTGIHMVRNDAQGDRSRFFPRGDRHDTFVSVFEGLQTEQ